MLVVHVSLTPLAGAPIRVVRALQRHAGVEARLINLAPQAYGQRTFPEDLAWKEQQGEAQELLARADVVHFHHWFDFHSRQNPFGFDFQAHLKPGARTLLQWHSSPQFIARDRQCDPAQLANTKIPQMVMAQYHERYYPRAFPVPLIVELAPLLPTPQARSRPVVFFAPSRSVSAHAERWETKGKPEVLSILRALERRGLLEAVVLQGVPFEECQRRMAQADIVIDDTVTGSYHTTSLEALALGKATVCYLDQRCQAVLARLTGSTDLPLVNTHLEQLERVLKALCADRVLVSQLGQYSRDWMQRHYAEATMVAHYVRGYQELLATGGLHNPDYLEHSQAKNWLFRELPDLQWSARKKALYSGVLGVALRRSTHGLRQNPKLKALLGRLKGRRANR